MLIRNYLLYGLFIVVSSGCSSTSCCNWWGRNSDGSNNLAHNKPSPVQQGPIAGTYVRPGNTATVIQPVEAAQQSPPVVSLTPPASTAPRDASSPLMTPPNAPSGVSSSQFESANKAGVMPPSQLPPAAIAELPDNKPSIPSPAIPSAQVAMPQVQSLPLDLTLPGTSSTNNAVSNSPTPLLLAPPNVEMPSIAAPTIAKPMDIAPPKVSSVKEPNKVKSADLNPGTTPPPLAPSPAVPVLEKK